MLENRCGVAAWKGSKSEKGLLPFSLPYGRKELDIKELDNH